MSRLLLSLFLILAQSTTLKNSTVLKGSKLIAGGLAPPTILASGSWAWGDTAGATTTVVTGNGGGTANINMPSGKTGFMVCWFQNTLVGYTVTASDTAGNAWTLFSKTFDSDNWTLATFYAANTTANASDVGTCTISNALAGNKAEVVMGYMSGLATSSPADVTTAGDTSGSSGTTATSAAYTTTSAAEVICQTAAIQFNSNAWVAGTIGGHAATIFAWGDGSGGNSYIATQCYIASAIQTSQTAAISFASADWNTTVNSLHQ